MMQNAQLAAQDDEQGPSVLYRRIFGTLTAASPSDVAAVATGVPPWDAMFKAPSHTLPPINRLLDEFLAQTLQLSLGGSQRTLQEALVDESGADMETEVDETEDPSDVPMATQQDSEEEQDVDAEAEMAARLAARFEDVMHCSFAGMLTLEGNGNGNDNGNGNGKGPTTPKASNSKVNTPKLKDSSSSKASTPKASTHSKSNGGTPKTPNGNPKTPKQSKSTGKKAKKNKTPKAAKA